MAYNPDDDSGYDPNAPINQVRNRVRQQVTDPTVPTGPNMTAVPRTPSPNWAAPSAPAGPTNYSPNAGPSALGQDPTSSAPGASMPMPGSTPYQGPVQYSNGPLAPGVTAANNEATVTQNLASRGITDAPGTNISTANGPNAWIDSALQQAQSTDDPNYWYSKIAADPKAMAGDASAIAYWQGRIAQGDGALAVRNGTTQKFNDGGGSGAASAPANAFTEQVRQLLMQRIANDTGSVDPNSNQIKAPMDAAQLQADRGLQTERTALAEQLYAQGDLGSNSLNQGIQQSAERNATGLAQTRAGLISQEYASRRADLNDAMQQALASGDAESARQIQMAIANLNATVQREGYGVSLAESTTNANAGTVKGTGA
jgi:hypothetical protein